MGTRNRFGKLASRQISAKMYTIHRHTIVHVRKFQSSTKLFLFTASPKIQWICWCGVAIRVHFVRLTHIDCFGPIVFFAVFARPFVFLSHSLVVVCALIRASVRRIWMRSTFLCSIRVCKCVRFVGACVCDVCAPLRVYYAHACSMPVVGISYDFLRNAATCWIKLYRRDRDAEHNFGKACSRSYAWFFWSAVSNGQPRCKRRWTVVEYVRLNSTIIIIHVHIKYILHVPVLYAVVYRRVLFVLVLPYQQPFPIFAQSSVLWQHQLGSEKGCQSNGNR